jgi:hypothetical protein
MNNLRIIGIPVKIQMAHLPNASTKNYASANLDPIHHSATYTTKEEFSTCKTSCSHSSVVEE